MLGLQVGVVENILYDQLGQVEDLHQLPLHNTGTKLLVYFFYFMAKQDIQICWTVSRDLYFSFFILES